MVSKVTNQSDDLKCARDTFCTFILLFIFYTVYIKHMISTHFLLSFFIKHLAF